MYRNFYIQRCFRLCEISYVSLIITMIYTFAFFYDLLTGRLVKSFFAMITFERFLTSVNFDMFSESARIAGFCTATFTFERFFTRVNSDVYFWIVWIIETFVTMFTRRFCIKLTRAAKQMKFLRFVMFDDFRTIVKIQWFNSSTS